MEENRTYTDRLSGLSFEYRLTEVGAIVTGAVSCVEKVMIPSVIDGMAVTQIGEYAFSGRNELSEVWLPFSVAKIGRHAFYNCRKLRTAALSAEAVDVCDGAFKNCEALHTVIVKAASGGYLGLKNILYDLEQDILCEIRISDKWDGGAALTPIETIKLLFPSNSYEYISNYAARIFHEVAYGSGYFYRQCACEKYVDFSRYDELFGYACREERKEVMLWLAFFRIRYPHELSAAAKERYLAYLRDSMEELIKLLIGEDDFDAARFLADSELFDSESAGRAAEAARKLGSAEYAGYFMKRKMERFGRQKRSFEL